MAAALGYGSPAIALDATYEFPKGIACADFGLRAELRGVQEVKEFKEKNGFVRSLTAGQGAAILFTNLVTGKTLSLKPNGSVNYTITYKPDGSYITQVTGHTVLVFFPTDFPPGPSTTLYVGRVVFRSDALNNFTLLQQSGKKTDICAALG
jgi:hypothetical protein